MRAAAIAVSVLLCAHAAADPKPLEQAKAHFKQGRAFQDVGEHAKAADEYKAAYALDPRPEMLFNIAQAYRLAGDKPAALDYFKQYLVVQPSGAGADEARTHVAALTKAIADETPQEPVAPAPVAQPEPAPAPRAPEMVTARGPRGLRIAGLVTAGAGLVGLGVGVKFGLDARAASNDISSHDMGAWTNADHARFLEGERAERNMTISYVVGAVLVTGGAVMYYVGARTHLTPVVTAHAAGIMLWGAL